MHIIDIIPYEIVKDVNYANDSKLVISKELLKNATYKDGKSIFTFLNCKFSELEIESIEEVIFTEITVQFSDCFIEELIIENIASPNISIIFNNTIFQGRIESNNIKSIMLNNCLLLGSIFLTNLFHITITFTEENIFPRLWTKLIKKSQLTVQELLNQKQSYNIYNSKNIVLHGNFHKKDGRFYNTIYKEDRENSLGYIPSDKELEEFNLNFIIHHSDSNHAHTRISNLILNSLQIEGFAAGEVIIENTIINCIYLHNFSTQAGATFFNISPKNINRNFSKIEIKKTNLDKTWFDNVSFKDYSIISFYRTRFGQTSFTACEFPEDYKKFDTFKTIENIHYPEKRTDKYYKNRYEVFLQLKKLLESSGNFYEAQKLHSVSNEALSNIRDLSVWDKTILLVNKYSNSHGLSIKKPLLLMLSISIPIYISYLLSIGRIFNSNPIDYKLIGYYFTFIDITHKVDFLISIEKLNGWSLFIDYLNKILVGFFIYQFIAAFRKYGKK